MVKSGKQRVKKKRKKEKESKEMQAEITLGDYVEI